MRRKSKGLSQKSRNAIARPAMYMLGKLVVETSYIQRTEELQRNGHHTTFLWVPGHTGDWSLKERED